MSTDPNTGCKQCDCNLGNDAVIVGSVSGNPDNPNQQSHHTVGTTAPTSSLKTKSDELNKKPGVFNEMKEREKVKWSGIIKFYEIRARVTTKCNAQETKSNEHYIITLHNTNLHTYITQS